jgi:hypothetical protein
MPQAHQPVWILSPQRKAGRYRDSIRNFRAIFDSGQHERLPFRGGLDTLPLAHRKGRLTLIAAKQIQRLKPPS